MSSNSLFFSSAVSKLPLTLSGVFFILLTVIFIPTSPVGIFCVCLVSVEFLNIPWTERPGGLQSMGSQRVRHD